MIIDSSLAEIPIDASLAEMPIDSDRKLKCPLIQIAS